MRLSISTKIFFGFVAVILAFGASGLYSFSRTAGLRENVVFLRKGAFPLKEGFLRLEEKLRSYYTDVLEPSRRVTELEKQRDRLPALQPFREWEALANQLGRAIQQADLDQSDRVQFEQLAEELRSFASQTNLHERIMERRDGAAPLEGLDLGNGEASEPVTNAELLDRYAKAFVRAVDEQRFTDAATLALDIRRVVNELWRQVKAQRRSLDRLIAAVNERAEEDEARAAFTAAISTAGALFVSLVVMFLTQLAIKRVRLLIDGVRRISAGEYTERVEVRGGDEIAQLAGEFNGMAASLHERDRMLAAQREELIRADRLATIGKMSAQITHEIRNPLSSIGLNAELLDEELGNGEPIDLVEARALLGAISSEVDRLTGVTEQYLRFARLPRPQLESVDVVSLVENLLGFTAEELNQHGIVVRKDWQARPKVRADEGQLWQVLLNIVRNALEAMVDGGELVVRVTEDAERGMGAIELADNGPGIADDVREKIFEPFFSTKEHGTGIGLALVHEIVAEHSGELSVSSVEPTGTSFRIELPLAITAIPPITSVAR